MSNPEDLDPSAVVAEPNAKITETETKFRRVDILQPLHVSFLGGEEARQAMQ